MGINLVGYELAVSCIRLSCRRSQLEYIWNVPVF